MFGVPRLASSPFEWIRRSRITPLLIFVLIPILPMLGCYGEFALTKVAYEANGEVSTNGVVTSLVMWVFAFFFIYSVCIIVDVFILNLIEFWDGQNPMTAGVYDMPDGSQVVVTPSEDGREAQLEIKKDGKLVETRKVVKTDDGHFDILNASGKVVGTVDRQHDGSLELARPDSTRKATITPAMMTELRTQAGV